VYFEVFGSEQFFKIIVLAAGISGNGAETIYSSFFTTYTRLMGTAISKWQQGTLVRLHKNSLGELRTDLFMANPLFSS
jgi:hypothetical protein